MKAYIVILVLTFSYISLSCARIIEDSPVHDHLGYGNSNMHANGEEWVIKKFIPSNGTVFDVGANKGEWSKCVIQHHPKNFIYAFEPVPALYKELNKHISHSNFRSFNCALSHTQGTSQFFYYPNLSGLSSLYNRPVMQQQFHAKPIMLTIQMDTLDHFCEKHAIKHIDFLKIDTEGNELKILQGALKLLNMHAIDIIQFEYGGTYPDAHITLKEVYDLLTSCSYQLYRILPDALIRIPKWRQKLENATYSNYLAIKN